MKSIKNIVFVLTVLTCAVFIASCASTGGGSTGERAPLGIWTFENPDNETGGWWLTNAEFYQYKGTAKLSRDDTTFGRGMLRLDVDFTGHDNIEWSEVKIANDFPKSINMKNINWFTFDFYYNPSFRKTGTFKPKIWSNNGSKFINEAGLDMEEGEDAGNGFIKVPVKIFITTPGGGFIPDMRLSVAGSLTDYKGPVFFDNIAWVEK
jgi:hypothetical protein